MNKDPETKPTDELTEEEAKEVSGGNVKHPPSPNPT